MHRGRASSILIGIVVVVVAILVLAQIFVPGIAAKEIRKEVDKYGVVESVSVHAFPAIELAWKAGSATVKIKRITVTENQAIKLLEETKKIKDLDMYMKNLTLKVAEAGTTVTLTGTAVKVYKRGNAITAQMNFADSQLKSALPGGFEATPVANAQGKFELKLKGGFLVGGSESAIIDGVKGKIVAEIAESGGESLALFEKPEVSVGNITASVLPGYVLVKLSATLR